VISHRLEEVRMSIGLSKKDFAIKLGITAQGYNNYYKGEREIPTDLSLKVNHLFNISLDWLLTGKGSMYLEEKKSNSNVDTGFQDCEIHNNKGSIAINISKSDFKDDSAEIEELISLLKYAPKSFIIKIIEKLRAFKELSQI